MELETEIVAEREIEAPADVHAERDYEAEARAHGWSPQEDFKGDKNRWVDAETFVKRADEVMPFLKKQNGALKRDLDEMKRTVKELQAFYSKAEARDQKRAMDDLQARHDEAVELGDVAASRAVLRDMEALKADVVAVKADEPEVDPAELQRELADWTKANDWYVIDDTKRRYADLQADDMGPAEKWPDGRKAWFEEITRRVEDRFAETPRKPAVTNGSGNRTATKGARSYADLPAEARRMCDRFVKTVPGFTKEQYLRDYDWS